jgi:hypothetical protein
MITTLAQRLQEMTACDVPSTVSGWMTDPDLRRVFVRSAIGVEIDQAGAPFAELLEVTDLRLTLIDRAEEIVRDRMDFAFNDGFVLLVLEAVTRTSLELLSHRGGDKRELSASTGPPGSRSTASAVRCSLARGSFVRLPILSVRKPSAESSASPSPPSLPPGLGAGCRPVRPSGRTAGQLAHGGEQPLVADARQRRVERG